VTTCFYCGFPNKEGYKVCRRCSTEGSENAVDKTYKTWEMIKLVSENQNLKFTCKGDTLCADVHMNSVGSLVVTATNDHFVTNSDFMQAEWKLLIRHPVKWRDALEAYLEGKIVEVYCDSCEKLGSCMRSTCVLVPHRQHICPVGLQSGTWYIRE